MSKIFVNVSLSNAETCVCCDEDGNTVDCCFAGSEFGGLYHPDGIEAAQVWAAEHQELAAELSGKANGCCDGECEATSSLEEEKTIFVDLPLDGSMVTINGDGVVPAAETADGTVVLNIPEGVVTKSGVLSDPEVIPSVESDDSLVGSGGAESSLLDAGLPESCIDELLGAGLTTPEEVLAHEDLSQIKGIGKKTKDKILRILNESE